MKKLLLLTAALSLLALAAPAAAQPEPIVLQFTRNQNDRVMHRARLLRDAALSDTIAWDIAEGLTTEIGPRLGGTPAEARAREWAVAKLKALGFSNVHVEEFRMPTWVRGEERAEIVGRFAQPLHITALGGSAATPAEGIVAEVVRFENVEALRVAPDGSLKGKIAFVSHDMKPTQDGSGYGFAGPARWNAPSIASSKGAVAAVIRSVGTDYHRNPHTGGTTWATLTPSPNAAAALGSEAPATVKPIPAGALSLPDAENLTRMLERGPVRMKLVLTPRWIGEQVSGNVVAEVPGSDPEAGVVLIGGHLDSWDLATGAFDNAAGVAITAAAAKHIMDAGQPRRTIRVVWFGAEEVGVFGGNSYHEAHKDEGDVVFVSESDFGADKVWKIDCSFAEPNQGLCDRVSNLVAPLGVLRGADPAGAGADLGRWTRGGTAAIDLNQDGTRYFDYHHTPDDTLDKIDPEQLRQNVAAWVAMLAMVANAPGPIGKVPAADDR